MKSSFKKDLAGATLVTGIFSIIFICLCAGFAIDVTKNVHLKSSFNSRAQQSAQAVIKTADSRGSLTDAAPGEFVKIYMGTSTGGSNDRDETKVWNSEACSTRTITDWNGAETEVEMPYIVMKFDADRRLGTNSTDAVWVSEGGGTPQLVSGIYNPAQRNKVFSAEVHDSSINVMLSMFGMPCQDYTARVSAITFGSDKDTQDY